MGIVPCRRGGTLHRAGSLSWMMTLPERLWIRSGFRTHDNAAVVCAPHMGGFLAVDQELPDFHMQSVTLDAPADCKAGAVVDEAWAANLSPDIGIAFGLEIPVAFFVT